MIGFIKTNIATIIIVIAIITLVVLAIRKIVKDRKSGIGPCGQKCSECPKYYECNKSG